MTASLARHHVESVKYKNTKIIHGMVVFWLFACLCLAIFNRDLLPGKYFFDSGNIASRFGYVQSFVLGNSYDNTALFYDLLPFSGSYRLTAFITGLVFSAFAFKCFTSPYVLNKQSAHNILIFVFVCVSGAVYLAQYSKESIVMVVSFLFFLLSVNRARQIAWLLVVCVYAAYFRSYWFLVLAFYIYYSTVFKFTRNPFLLVLSVVFAFLVLAIAFKSVLGVDLAYYRYSVNDTRINDLNANTMIMPLLPTGNIFWEWLNAVVQFFLMFFPFPLLTGNPLYFVFFLVVASLGIRMFFVINTLTQARMLNAAIRPTRCIALFVAFVTIQSIFEPDYGSYMKHLTPILPLVIYVFCWHQQWILGWNASKIAKQSNVVAG